ncbi:MAG TPA: hypothetical protein VMH81_17135 [Bryobacteraceae bacterium]|nr:hypothetical protein [Bryobacteraceae bacterium]
MTWLAACASLLMAAATVCAFIWAVQKDYFRDIEDAKYQVFWSDLEELVDSPKEKMDVRSNEKS